MKSRLLPGVPAALGLALALATAAPANPIPDWLLRGHVQSVAGDFCVDPPVTACDDLVESTTLRGPLEFDVFLLQPSQYPYFPCDQLIAEISWPPSWSFVGYDACGADAYLEHWSGGGVLHMPVVSPEEGWGLLRVVLDVDSPGHFSVDDIDSCAAEVQAEVRAGLDCGNCSWPCSWGPFGLYGADFPMPNPTLLELSAPTGQETVGQIEVGFWDPQPGETYEFIPTAAWLTLEAQRIGPHNADVTYQVTATADASGLAPGTYEAWIEARRPRCSECAQILFTVTDYTPPAVSPESWGSVKNRFRDSETTGSPEEVITAQ